MSFRRRFRKTYMAHPRRNVSRDHSKKHQLLYGSLNHTFAGAVPQLFHVAHWRRAKQPLILAGEVRSVTVAHAVPGPSGVEAFAHHETPRLLEPQELLEL